MPAVEMCFSFSMANLLLVMFLLDEYLLLAKVWHRQSPSQIDSFGGSITNIVKFRTVSVSLTTSPKIALHKLADCTT